MSLTWDDEVTLVGYTSFQEDDIGQQVPIETETTVCCCRMPVSRSEFYNAGQNGIEVSEILTVHSYEYNGENTVIFNGKRMRVIRTYRKNLEECELTCTERIGNGNNYKSESVGSRD